MFVSRWRRGTPFILRAAYDYYYSRRRNSWSQPRRSKDKLNDEDSDERGDCQDAVKWSSYGRVIKKPGETTHVDFYIMEFQSFRLKGSSVEITISFFLSLPRGGSHLRTKVCSKLKFNWIPTRSDCFYELTSALLRSNKCGEVASGGSEELD